MSLAFEPEWDERPIIDAALDACDGDRDRVKFLRSQNDMLRAALIEKDRLIDRAIIAMRENGLHADADDIEKLAAPF